jgi:hypothetical protein
LETPLKTILDKLRARPEWQHPDPAVRAEAVLRLPTSEQEALCTIAREDADARVRRAAVKKVHDVSVLGGLAEKDADEGVREEAAQRLVTTVLHARDEGTGRGALAGLREPRHLAAVAKAAALSELRLAAVAAIEDAKGLSSVVREAEDPAVRLSALARIQDPATLAAIAAKSETKAVALAAVERVRSPADLEAIAARARVGAVARRAQALLASAAPAAPELAAPAPTFADEEERAAYEKAREAQAREAAARDEATRSRRAVCEALDGASGGELPKAIEEARRAWSALSPLAGPEADEQSGRFEQAVRDAERRHAASLEDAARNEKLEEVAAKAEALAGSAEPEDAGAAFLALEREFELLAGGRDAGAASRRFAAAGERLRAHERAGREAAARHEREQRERLEALVLRAAELGKAEAPSLRDVDHAMHDLREALEHSAGPTRRDGGLHHRLESARKALYPRWQQLREDAEWKRWANVAVQEELCTKAEELLQSEDMEATAKRLQDLDARWRQAKEAPKEKGEALWTRFKAARDAVKAKVDAYFAKQAQELAENLRQKQALCEKAEALAESTDWLKTADELKRLQEEWKAIGAAPRAQSQAIWLRFRKPCDRFFTRWQEHRAERQQEWTRNLEKKEALCAQAEAVMDSTDWEPTAAEIRRLQSEWRTAGAVRRSKSEAVWQRFRTACDHFFDRYKNRDELARKEVLGRYEAACLQIESLVSAADGASPPEDLLARLSAAQAAWRQAGDVPRDAVAPLLARFGAARDHIVEAWPHAFEGTDLDPEANRRKLEKLCLRVEGLLQQLGPEPASIGDLATRLKDALATNTMGGRAAVDARWNEAAAEVEAAQASWQRVGPVPGAPGVTLAERFKRAVDRFSSERPRVERPKPGGHGRRPSRPRP